MRQRCFVLLLFPPPQGDQSLQRETTQSVSIGTRGHAPCQPLRMRSLTVNTSGLPDRACRQHFGSSGSDFVELIAASRSAVYCAPALLLRAAPFSHGGNSHSSFSFAPAHHAPLQPLLGRLLLPIRPKLLLRSSPQGVGAHASRWEPCTNGATSTHGFNTC